MEAQRQILFDTRCMSHHNTAKAVMHSIIKNSRDNKSIIIKATACQQSKLVLQVNKFTQINKITERDPKLTRLLHGNNQPTIETQTIKIIQRQRSQCIYHNRLIRDNA